MRSADTKVGRMAPWTVGGKAVLLDERMELWSVAVTADRMAVWKVVMKDTSRAERLAATKAVAMAAM